MVANNLKLTITATQKGVCLSGEPARTITDEITSDRVELTITQRGRCVNHLVCAGAGEGTERTILHLYANEAGEISQTQSIFGIDEVTNFYDYSNADDDELLEQGTKKLADLQSEGGIEVSIPDGIDANVGDVIVGFDANTGATVTAFDYQLNRHCSKTPLVIYVPSALFDYQLNRHCSKTRFAFHRAPPTFDYQLNRHCSKTRCC